MDKAQPENIDINIQIPVSAEAVALAGEEVLVVAGEVEEGIRYALIPIGG